MRYVVTRYLTKNKEPEKTNEGDGCRFRVIEFAQLNDALLFCKAAALRDEDVDLYMKSWEDGDYIYYELDRETGEREDIEDFESE